MNDWDRDLRVEIEELAAGDRQAGPHLEPDELAAYHAGELAANDAERALGHLVACPECTGLLLDLNALMEPKPDAAPAVSDHGKAAVWRNLREEIGHPEIGRRRSSPPFWLSAIAAALLVSTVGLSVWVANLRRTVDELSRPQINAPVLDLYEGTVRGGESIAPGLAVPPGARFFTLILNPAGRRRFERYRVEIVPAQGGAAAWSGQDLAPNAYGSFSLIVPRRALGAGDYRVRLLGLTGTGVEPIEEYALRVE
jgi:hypothetical protein